MSPEVLACCARPHSPEEVVRAVEEARAAGFLTINMDLIAGLRGDSPAAFKASLESVLALRPENVTVHTLALKRGADIKEGRAVTDHASPGPRELSEMLSGSLRLLPEEGYSPYYLYRQKYMAGGFENVGWTLPGHACLYNIGMMEELLTVVSLGAGGVTKLIDAEKGIIKRVTNKKYPKEYIADPEGLAADSKMIGAFISGMLHRG
jgi:oxygen-independent coproporphyrinogen-3 oxidase